MAGIGEAEPGSREPGARHRRAGATVSDLVFQEVGQQSGRINAQCACNVYEFDDIEHALPAFVFRYEGLRSSKLLSDVPPRELAFRVLTSRS